VIGARDTQQAPGVEAHELIYEQAMRRIAALSETWQQAVDRVGARAAVPAPAAPLDPAPLDPAPLDAAQLDPAQLDPAPPERAPVEPVATDTGTVPAVIRSIGATETAELVAARAEAPRWRRSLVS
jgi:hypothetical protein